MEIVALLVVGGLVIRQWLVVRARIRECRAMLQYERGFRLRRVT